MTITIDSKPTPEVWFITGASSGLGLAVLKHVLSKGDKAVATLRKPEALSEISKTYPSSQLLVIKLDVTKEEEIASVFKAAREKFGRIDVVYNNAGYGVLAEIEGTPTEGARGQMEVNFWGAANVSKEAVKFFREVNKPAGGRLLQASSMGGAVAAPGLGYYCASKFGKQELKLDKLYYMIELKLKTSFTRTALEGFSEALSQELLPSWNIKITILQLGAFRTKAVEQIPTFPLHPSYEGSNSIYMREYFGGPMDGIYDAANGAREIYKIAADQNAPLHVPLGFDTIAKINKKLESVIKGVVDSEKWSVNL